MQKRVKSIKVKDVLVEFLVVDELGFSTSLKINRIS